MSLKSDVAVKVATEAAGRLVDSYYRSLKAQRKEIASFYCAHSAMPDGKALPIIVWNGNSVPDAQTLQQIFVEQMPRSQWEVQSYDAHTLNPNLAGPESATSGKAMSILVVVNGFVDFGESGVETRRIFSDTLVLVPNPIAANLRGKHTRDWQIQSHIFRLVG